MSNQADMGWKGRMKEGAELPLTSALSPQLVLLPAPHRPRVSPAGITSHMPLALPPQPLI